MLTEWFNHYACLLAKQLPKQYKTNEIYPKPWVIDKHDLEKSISSGVFKWLISIHDIKYITIRQGLEANYLVFLTAKMEKFHETYLIK